jgi:hypothetical protein
MGTWKDEYLAALEARDDVEKANLDFYEACIILRSSEAFELTSPDETLA